MMNSQLAVRSEWSYKCNSTNSNIINRFIKAYKKFGAPLER